MSDIIPILSDNYLSSYIEKKRDKLDESLVSLRFMKEIDTFMDLNKLNQKDIAKDLKTSAAFISQLMSGTKKINTGFINKFEKKYNIEFEISIKNNDLELYRRDDMEFFRYETNQSSIKIEMNISGYIHTDKLFSFENSFDDFYKLNLPTLQQK